MSLKDAWFLVENEINEALKNPGHPFRYVTLATSGLDQSVKQRIVVLRGFKNRSEFLIYTDGRSAKVEEIINSRSVSLLFYHNERSIQVRVNGVASVIKTGDEKELHWKKAGKKSHHSYTSTLPPGSVIKSPEEAWLWKDEEKNHFCLIKIVANEMEFLKLDGIRHLRSRLKIQDENHSYNWITP